MLTLSPHSVLLENFFLRPVLEEVEKNGCSSASAAVHALRALMSWAPLMGGAGTGRSAAFSA